MKDAEVDGDRQIGEGGPPPFKGRIRLFHVRPFARWRIHARIFRAAIKFSR